ncbi:hypothetical protein J1N35_026993 [Gossypium stocksii]|uniref:Small ribosomal subunit protein mS38 n=1 Tax=Gossypium stocksii TaxID=47602 RepID=A0A9D3VA24_9ROSI|nr:hypothetical protein J1N35_026993 [Gossypium stocksii]
MAYLMHKLFKNKSTQTFILSLKTPQHQHRLSKLSPSLIPQQTHHFSLIQPENSLENDKSTEPLKLYPSFRFGYLLNPVNSIGFDPMAIMEVEEGEVETEDDNAGKVWADSVKKKRKKKMNKHKYKKLRKRLRRKT